jgi:hypothetical protein
LSAYFDASTGVATSGASATASMTNVGNGWFRCTLSYTSNTTSTQAYIATASGGATISSGDATKGIYIWGAQLE